MRLIRYLSLFAAMLMVIAPTWAQFDPDLPPDPPAPVAKTLLTLVASPSAGGTVSGGGKYAKGEKVAVKATASTGFDFVNWTDEEGTEVSVKKNFTFVKGEQPETLTAHFVYNPKLPNDPPKPDLPVYHYVTVKASPADGGTATTGSTRVKEGDRTRLRAVPAAGFEFLGWYVADTLFNTAADFSYTMQQADIHFEARFEYRPGLPVDPPKPDLPVYHNITATATPADGGSVTVESGRVAEGRQTRIYATASPGFVFQGFYVADTLYTLSPDFSYTMQQADIHFEARFEYRPGMPVDPSVPTSGLYTFYMSTVYGSPGQTLSFPVFLSCLDSVADMRFCLTFPRGVTPRTDNVKLGAEAAGYALACERVDSLSTVEESTYAIVLTGGRLDFCTTRLLTFDVAIGEELADTLHRVRITDIVVTNTKGETVPASASGGNIYRRQQNAEGTYYYLTILSTGNGTTRANNRHVRNGEQVLPLLEGTSANVFFMPDYGYRIGSVVIEKNAEERDVTDEVVNNRLLIADMHGDVRLTARFVEAEGSFWPLTITAKGPGTAMADSLEVRDGSLLVRRLHGSSATVRMVPDEGCYVERVVLDGESNVTGQIADSCLTIENITAGHTLDVFFEQKIVIPDSVTLTILIDGQGTVSCGGVEVQGDGRDSVRVPKGKDHVLQLLPAEGWHLDQLLLDFEDVTASVLPQVGYILRNASTDVTFHVRFVEDVPEPVFHQLTLTAEGGGKAVYGDEEVRRATRSFSVADGAEATVTFVADVGWHIATVRRGAAIVTDELTENHQLSVQSMTCDTTFSVVFAENEPEHLYYQLKVTSTGQGTTTCNGKVVDSGTASFSMRDDAQALITVQPEVGHQLEHFLVDGVESSGLLVDGRYTIKGFTKDVAVQVEYTKRPDPPAPDSVTVTVIVEGQGTVSCDSMTVQGGSEGILRMVEGGSCNLLLTPADGHYLRHLLRNEVDVTAQVGTDMYYRLTVGTSDVTLRAVFAEDLLVFTVDGINYGVLATGDNRVEVLPGNYSGHLRVPASVDYDERTWRVIGLHDGAFAHCPELVTVGVPNTLTQVGSHLFEGDSCLTAILWPASVKLSGDVMGSHRNPNMLFYVADREVAPEGRTNIIVNGVADSIVLSDGVLMADFYCPQPFFAREISYSHEYLMESGYGGEVQGWETLSLPFAVQQVRHATKQVELTPFAAIADAGTDVRPFWLYRLGSEGWEKADGIDAYTPYLVSMPQHPYYHPDYRVGGKVVFSARNVDVEATAQLVTSVCGTRTFVPNFQMRNQSQQLYVLNAYSRFAGEELSDKGNLFAAGLRPVRPFEACFTDSAVDARECFGVMEVNDWQNNDLLVDDLQLLVPAFRIETDAVYDLQGRRCHSINNKGVYISRGRKVVAN